MQTFLPFPNFVRSVQSLDKKRLGKQRVEVKQILVALGITVGETVGNKNSSWASHPACDMWRDWPGPLAAYGHVCTLEWKRRGYRDSLSESFLDIATRLNQAPPDWLGWDAFHISHQSNLIRKDPMWYAPLFPGVPDDLPYIWPSPEMAVKLTMGYTTGMAQLSYTRLLH